MTAVDVPGSTEKKSSIMGRTGVWAVCGTAVLLALNALGGVATDLQRGASLGVALLGLLAAIIAVGIGVWFYRVLVMRRWARREPVELTGLGWRRNLGTGLLIGLMFMVMSFGLVTLLGGYQIHGFTQFGARQLVTIVSMTLVSAVLEELIFRGVLLQAFEKWLGWIPALVITSAIFGAAHFLNGESSPGSALSIAIEAGFLLGAAFLWRRNLWLVIGIHAAWNATEALLNIPVSGTTSEGLLQVTSHGSTLLTGGDFGIEGSIAAVGMGAALGVAFLILKKRMPSAAAGR